MTPAEEILAKSLLRTHFNSAEIRTQIAAEIRRRSVFTARCAQEDFLMGVREAAAEVAGGRINNADFRERMRGALDALGYDPKRGGWLDDPNNDGAPVTGLQNLRSARRLNLIANTQADMAASVARLNAETDGTLFAFPAWRLARYETRAAERKWLERWWNAAEAVDWEGVAPGGEMVALKGSPIWQALGDGEGGYGDTLGNPYPPFAFNSGMDWNPVSRAECAQLGLDPDDGEPVDASLAPSDADIRRAREKYGDDFVDGLLKDLEKYDVD